MNAWRGFCGLNFPARYTPGDRAGGGQLEEFAASDCSGIRAILAGLLERL
jgi:hypothetical protein